MRGRGIEPSITTYGTMLTAAADAGDLQVLRDTWRAMIGSGMDVNGSCINAYVTGLARLVGCCCMAAYGCSQGIDNHQPVCTCRHRNHQQDEVGEAEQLLHSLTAPNARIKPMNATVVAMLGAYMRAGKHDRVQSLFNVMPSLGLQHSSEAYHTLIASCVRSDRWLDALNLLEQLCGGGAGAAAPSSDCFALVLDALNRASQGMQSRVQLVVSSCPLIAQQPLHTRENNTSYSVCRCAL